MLKPEIHRAARLVRAVAVTAFVSLGYAAAAHAQWPAYPTPNVPTTPDGKPDLNGPVPRTAQGRPDLSGIWSALNPRNRRNAARSSDTGAAAAGTAVDSGAAVETAAGTAARTTAAASTPPKSEPPSTPPLATFSDIGAHMPGGLPLRPWAKALKEKRMAANDKDNPDAHCLPLGYMQFHLHPQPRKMIQTPNELLIIYESNYGLRDIFTDGRSLPDNDPESWWYGYSVGHWEGDTLVVTSNHFRDGGWLDVHGSPLTDQATITERFRRPDFGHLQIAVTIDDPKAYTKPFTVRVNQQIMLDTNLIEFICNENEQSSKYYHAE
jgi:hypothetical protein